MTESDEQGRQLGAEVGRVTDSGALAPVGAEEATAKDYRTTYLSGHGVAADSD